MSSGAVTAAESNCISTPLSEAVREEGRASVLGGSELIEPEPGTRPSRDLFGHRP